jgi:drug/metabolite transporter (DMT)-like permease
LFAALAFGVTTPASKALLGTLGPFELSGLLYAGAALGVAPWAFAHVPRRIACRDAVRLLGAVVFGGIIGPLLLLLGLSLASSASVSLWLNLETVATAVLARVLFQEHLSPRTWLAVALVVVASVLLSVEGLQVVWAGLLVAAACVAWGLDNNLTALIDTFTPAQVTFAKGVGAAAVNLTVGLLRVGQSQAPWSLVGQALVVGAVGYGASLVAYIAAARQLGATRSQLLFSTAPVFGLGVSWVSLGEPVRAVQVAAAALLGVALWLWQGESHAHAHVHGSTTHRHAHRHDDGHHEHSHDGRSFGTGWHDHVHQHLPVEHSHPHSPDLHHRHEH